MDAEDVLELLDAPLIERRELPNGFDPWRIQRFDQQRYLSEVRKRGYEKARQTKGVEVTCEVCGKVRVVHPMMRNQALACNEHKHKAFHNRCRAQGKRYYKTWRERHPDGKTDN